MNCCSDSQNNQPCCRVVSIVSVDERGQMVLPKDVREKAGIKTGDKLALVSWEQNNGVACLALIKADDLGTMVTQMLGPLLKEMYKEK
jgi:antitoxin PrlF